MANNPKNPVPVTNQNFSAGFRSAEKAPVATDEDVDTISMRLIAKNRAAYEKLAK